MAHDTYISPFQTRYASKEMQYIFSEDNKFKTWRRLWIALAKAEQKQGLPITDAQIAELEAHKDDINYDVAAAREKGVPPRRDEPRLCLRRAVPGGKGHHPSGGHQLLCGRQHRYPCHARGAGGSAPQAAERDGPVGRIRGRIQGHARAGLHICSPRSSPPWASAPRCGWASCIWITPKSRRASRGLRCWAARAPRAHRQALWSCLRATTQKSRRWRPTSPPRWVLKKWFPFRARRIPAKWTTMCCPRCPALRRAP